MNGILSACQAASLLGVSMTQVYRLIRRGDLCECKGLNLPNKAKAVLKDSVLRYKKKNELQGPQKPEHLLTIPQAASKIGASPDWIRSIIKNGRLKAVLIGRSLYIAPIEISRAFPNC